MYWFCHTLTSVLHGCTCVPILKPPPNSLLIPSLWVIPLHHPQHHLMHGTALAIRFTYNLHVSMPFSHIIPPSPSPTESKRLFNTSVSLPLSRIQGYCYHLCKFHIYAFSILYWCFSFWLTSLCIMGSSFIHLIRTDSNVFFLMAG